MLGALLAPRATQADGSAARRPALQWTRGATAAQCIDPRTLATRVEVLTGPVLVAPGSADYAIEGHIEARSRSNGFTLRLTVTDRHGTPRGERVIAQRARSCRELDATITFLIALTIDPDLSLDGLLPDGGLGGLAPDEVLLAELTAQPPAPVILPVEVAEPVARGAPEPPSPPAYKPSLPTPIETRPRWQLRTWLQVGNGELPRASFGGAIGLSLRVARAVWLDTQVRAAAPARVTPVDASHGLRSFALGGALGLCAGPTFGAWHVRGCLGPELLMLHAKGIGFEQELRASLWSWGALARLQLERALGPRWALTTQGWLRLGSERKRLVHRFLEESIPVHTVDRFALGAAIGLRVDLDRGNR